MTGDWRDGSWIQTYTGKKFFPMEPKVSDICIEDIAHALAHQCRFAGHCKRFYSVAEHCLLMAAKVSPQNQMWALLHDASEAYLVDVPRPIKPRLIGYYEAEYRLMYAICLRFGLPFSMPAEVKEADTRILMDERIQNLTEPPEAWPTDGEPLGVTLEFLAPERAEELFLAAADRFAASLFIYDRS